MHNIHDKSYRDLYSKKEIAIDLFKNMLKEPWAKDLKEEDLTLVNKSFVTTDYDDTESDIVYSANINGTKVFFYILLEFQSTIDYRMPLRLLFYMCEILRYDAVNAKHKKSDKNLKIPAVVPLVLYNGTDVWDVPTEFRKIIYNENLFGKGLLNFTYDIIDVNNSYSKEQLINSKNVTAAIFLLDQKIDALEFLQRIKAIALFFDGLSEVEMKAIKNWIKNTIPEQLSESAIKILDSKREDVELMVASNAFILEEMKEKAKLEGAKQGRLEGKLEGKIEGKQEGKIEGKLEAREETRLKNINRVKNFIKKKFDCNDEIIINKIEDSSFECLETIIDNILDIDSLDDIVKLL